MYCKSCLSHSHALLRLWLKLLLMWPRDGGRMLSRALLRLRLVDLLARLTVPEMQPVKSSHALLRLWLGWTCEWHYQAIGYFQEPWHQPCAAASVAVVCRGTNS